MINVRCGGLFPTPIRNSKVSTFSPLAKVCLAVTLIIAAPVAKADSEAPPRDALHRSPNGQFELVMLPASRFARKDALLRKRYPKSGLYRKGRPTHPLWTIDWYAWKVYPASDGHHVVRMGRWPSSAEELAVAFYRDGRLLRQYKINQLVKDPESLPHSVSHFQWAKTITFNDAKRLLRVTTLANEKYLFDEQGRLVEGRFVSPYQPKSLADGFLHKGDLPGLLKLGATALPELAQTLRNGTGRRQEMALLALCVNGKASLPELERLSLDSSAEVRASVAMVLSEISAPDGKPILLKLLQDQDSKVRIGAIAALIQIHEESLQDPALQAAVQILSSGSIAEKRDLLYALQRFRLPALVPYVLPILELPQGKETVFPGLAERARYWLGNTTFQRFEHLDVGSDAEQKMTKAWKDWWAVNQSRSSEDWYRQAVERDLTLLGTENSTGAVNHLEELTGQSFGSQQETLDNKVVTQWKTWWQRHKNLRPGQIVLESLTAANKQPGASTEALQHLPLLTDKRDVAGLVILYSSLKEWERDYVEIALRRITNVDSFGISLTGGAKAKSVMAAWKDFAAEE